MNRTTSSGNAHGVDPSQGYLPSPRLGRLSGLFGRHFKPGGLMSVWLWLAMLIVAVALYGCGGGDGTDDESAPDDEEAEMDGGYTEPGAEKRQKQPRQQQAAKKKEEAALPDDFAQWQEDHYYQARRQWDPRLVEAVAYLGQQSAGAADADADALILTNLLKKSEEPPPSERAPARSSRDYDRDEEGDEEEWDEDEEDGDEEDEAYMDEEYEDEDEEDEDEEDEEYGERYPRGYGPVATPGRRTALASGPAVDLIRAIVPALGLNGSNTAWQTIQQVVEGTFETDSSVVATIAALETLVAHLSSQNETVLFRCLSAPQELRELGGPGSGARSGRGPTSDDRLTAEELQQEAFSLIAPLASEELRGKLAQHLAKPTTVLEDHDLFGGFLLESDPDNLGAQMVLYLAAGMGAEAKAVIEENFLVYSSDALAGVLGIPADQLRRERPARGAPGRRGYGDEGDYPTYDEEYDEEEEEYDEEEEEEYGRPARSPYRRPGRSALGGPPSRYDRPEAGGPRRPSRYDTGQQFPGVPRAPEVEAPDPDLPYRLARHLWASDFTGPLANRLNQAQSLDADAPMLLLASTMPVASMRSTLGNVLKAHWEEGPRALVEAGLLDDVISDPGLLAAIKALPRKEAKEEALPGRRLPGRTPIRRPGYREEEESYEEEEYEERDEEYEDYRRPERSGRPGAKARTSDDPGVAWMFTSEDLVRVLCERFLAAARAQARAAGIVGQPAAGQAAPDLPFALREDATVVAEYHVDWPGSVQAKLSGVPLAGMKLHYVRAEMHTRFSTLESFFRRQLGSPEVRQVENGLWLDSLQPIPETGWKRSIDVMLTSSVSTEERADRRIEVPVTLDILCIDVGDPATGAITPPGEGAAGTVGPPAQPTPKQPGEAGPTTVAKPPMPGTPATVASGKIRGQDFTPDKASLSNGVLTLRQGEDFFPDLAVKVFLFLDEGQTPEGKSYNVSAGKYRGLRPHVHVLWKETGENVVPESEVFMDGYTMKLSFDKASGGKLPGKIELQLPDESKSSMTGSFVAELGEQ